MMARIRRGLQALAALVTLRFLRRGAERRERERLEEQRARERRRRLLEEGAQVDPRRDLGEQSEELVEAHEREGERSPRRAEPPLATELDTESSPRAELLVAASLVLGALAAGGFIVFYVVFPDTQLLGLTIGLAFLLLAVAAVVAAKRVFPQEKVAEEYHYFGDDEPQEDVQEIVEEAGSSLTRRRLLLGSAGAAGAALGGAALVPAASLGPNVDDIIYSTPWRPGRRVVDSKGRPISADDVELGSFLTGFPEGAGREELGSPLILVRVPLERLKLAPERREGAPEGILAFSKICPHAACAVSIYRNPLYQPTEPEAALVCPCHYSTFDPARGGHLLFGPAGRDLPQLPLRIGLLRRLEAAGDFYETIGPSYGGSRLRRQ
jgi:ubiquinol-cytochrome c reductase iron-sulfur subunit